MDPTYKWNSCMWYILIIICNVKLRINAAFHQDFGKLDP